MTDSDELYSRLLAVVRTIDFDKRYYGFYDQIRIHSALSNLKKADWEKALTESGLSFRYHSKERFFSSEREAIGKCEVWLNVAFQFDRAEFILNLITPGGGSGGPFGMLANSAAVSRNPGYTPDPPYPRLPFSNLQQLREVIRFGSELYADVKRALCSSGVCGDKE